QAETGFIHKPRIERRRHPHSVNGRSGVQRESAGPTVHNAVMEALSCKSLLKIRVGGAQLHLVADLLIAAPVELATGACVPVHDDGDFGADIADGRSIEAHELLGYRVETVGGD